MTDAEKYAASVKWPDSAEGVTVDLMLRIVGAATQRAYLDKWELIDKSGQEFLRSPLYHAYTEAVISGVGLMACLRALRAVDPAKADAFARDYWNLCDAGDSFGELLWQFTEEAGLDPALVKSAKDAATVESLKGV